MDLEIEFPPSTEETVEASLISILAASASEWAEAPRQHVNHCLKIR